MFYEIYEPSYCNFPESRNKKKNLISKIIFFILSADSKYYFVSLKKNIFEVLSVYF